MKTSACLAVAAAASVAATPAPAATVAVLGKDPNRVLVRVDPRTLEPLPGMRRIRLSRRALFALSPDSKRVAVSTQSEVAFADTATGHVFLDVGNDGFDASEGLYWIGSSKHPLVIAVGESKFGWEYTAVPSTYATVDTNVDPETAVRGFLVLSDGSGVDFFGRAETWFPLDAAPNTYYEAVADVAHDDVYVLYSAGVAAEVLDQPVYHPVPIGPGVFETAWAGHGRIAVWGADGLGILDTRTWTATSLNPNATGAVATRFGLVAWSNKAPGVTVYNRYNAPRMYVLPAKRPKSVTALGRYAYARVGDSQYSIDLRTGRVRSIRADAELAVPTLVSIP